jgi:hypothetical protein
MVVDEENFEPGAIGGIDRLCNVGSLIGQHGVDEKATIDVMSGNTLAKF